MNPYTRPEGVSRFPSNEEDRLATGDKNKNADGGEARTGGGTGGARGPASLEGAQAGGAGAGAGAGLLGVSPIPGFEGKSVSDCAIPTLYYVLQCYLDQKVFNEWSYIDEYSTEDEINEARANPRELVKNVGFEGKAFVVVNDIPKDEEGREQLLVTTYDHIPPMLEDVDLMNDESFRKELLSKILSERWNFLAMRDYAKRTKIIEEQVYQKNDFLGLAEERKLKPLISSTAGELYNNVARMNLRIKKENQQKIFALQKQLAGNR